MPMPRDVFTISQDQFDKLVELLTPINQLAVAQLALMPQPGARRAVAFEFGSGRQGGRANDGDCGRVLIDFFHLLFLNHG